MFNMLRMNQRSSESDHYGGEKRDDHDEGPLEWRDGISNLDWHPRRKQT